MLEFIDIFCVWFCCLSKIRKKIILILLFFFLLLKSYEGFILILISSFFPYYLHKYTFRTDREKWNLHAASIIGTQMFYNLLIKYLVLAHLSVDWLVRIEIERKEMWISYVFICEKEQRYMVFTKWTSIASQFMGLH